MDKPELETLDYKPPKCALPHENGGVLANPEQPNTNAMIIKTIQGLMTVVNDNLVKLRESIYIINSKQALIAAKALKEIDLFQKKTLFELQKAFE